MAGDLGASGSRQAQQQGATPTSDGVLEVELAWGWAPFEPPTAAMLATLARRGWSLRESPGCLTEDPAPG